jgi:hypothetical protein
MMTVENKLYVVEMMTVSALYFWVFIV